MADDSGSVGRALSGLFSAGGENCWPRGYTVQAGDFEELLIQLTQSVGERELEFLVETSPISLAEINEIVL